MAVSIFDSFEEAKKVLAKYPGISVDEAINKMRYTDPVPLPHNVPPQKLLALMVKL